MKVIKTIENGGLVLTVSGCLDTAASAAFDAAVEAECAGVKSVTFDFSALEFIASSALRRLVVLEKRLAAAGGSVTLRGLNDVVRDVFELTGLAEVFTIR